ncbi:unnamed protein product, partial [Porites lobata]
MRDDWNLGHAGGIGYLDAIAELVDYRKVNGASESVLRGLASTERTGHRCLTSQGALGHTRRTVGSRGALLDSRTEIAWLLKSCKEKLGAGLPIDLSFATKFLAVYLFIKTSMQLLDGYINHNRPLLRPTCDFVLVTRNGEQHNKLGELMSKLLFDATGKYVHSTRYRQIVETASCRQLVQSTISEDQKHSSVIVRVHYQKQRSREVASK